LENAKTTIGEALLPIVLQLATLFSEKVIPIVQQVADAFGEKSGGMGNTLSKLAGSIKDFVQPIFEGFKSAFDKIKKTVIENKDEFEAFFDVIKAAAPIIGNVIGKAFSIVGDVASVVLNIMANVVGALRGLINTAIDLINIAIRGFNLIKPGADISPVSKIGASSGSSSTGGISVPAASLPSGFTSGGTTSSAGGTTGGGTTTITGGTTGGGSAGGTLGGAVTKIAKDTKKVVDDVAGAFDDFTSGTTTLAGVMAASNKPFAFGTSGVNTNTLAGIMAASGQPRIEINVNAPSMMDEEGFKRATTEAFNNSFYRGTGGANSLQFT
jgi:phage-related protein